MFNTLVQSVMADPQYGGPIESYTHHGAEGVPGEGPYMLFWFDVQNGTVLRAAYQCNGCPSAIACGSMAARVLTGLSVQNALLLTGEDLIRIIGGLPEGKEDCASRTVSAVRNALG